MRPAHARCARWFWPSPCLALLRSFRHYEAPAAAHDVRSQLDQFPGQMFKIWGASYGSAFLLVRHGALAQSGQVGADVRPRRRNRPTLVAGIPIINPMPIALGLPKLVCSMLPNSAAADTSS
jgi:hypothetical protein